jgi:hypothetical protein
MMQYGTSLDLYQDGVDQPLHESDVRQLGTKSTRRFEVIR